MPTECSVGLDGKDGLSVWQDREPVVLGLVIKDLEARQGHQSSLDALLAKLSSGIADNSNLGACSGKGDVGVLDVLENVSALASLLNARALELGKVLAREGNDRRGLPGLDGNLVHGRDLISIGRSHKIKVWDGSEGHTGLDGLVGRSILAETNRVVCGDPDGSEIGQSRETNSTDGIGNKVEEGTSSGDVETVGVETVHDGTHGVLSDTVSDVPTGVISKLRRGVLEVDGIGPTGEIGAGQVGGTTKELRNGGGELGKCSLRELSGGHSRIRGFVNRKGLLPSVRELASDSSYKLCVLLWVLRLVLLKE